MASRQSGASTRYECYDDADQRNVCEYGTRAQRKSSMTLGFWLAHPSLQMLVPSTSVTVCLPKHNKLLKTTASSYGQGPNSLRRSTK